MFEGKFGYYSMLFWASVFGTMIGPVLAAILNWNGIPWVFAFLAQILVVFLGLDWAVRRALRKKGLQPY